MLVWWIGTVLPIRFYIPPTCTVSGNRWLVGQVFTGISTMLEIMAEIITKLWTKAEECHYFSFFLFPDRKWGVDIYQQFLLRDTSSAVFCDPPMDTWGGPSNKAITALETQEPSLKMRRKKRNKRNYFWEFIWTSSVMNINPELYRTTSETYSWLAYHLLQQAPS